MAHQNARGLVALGQEVGRDDEIIDVRREVGIGEIPLALAKACEVEPEYANALPV